MDGKITAYLLLLIVIFAGVWGIYLSTEIDDANARLALVTVQVESVKGHVKTRTEALELKREAAALVAANAILKEETEKLQSEMTLARQQHQDLKDSFEKAILAVRQNSIGMTLDEIELTTGLKLKKVKIQRIEGDQTTVSHSEGVSKLSPEMLPPDLQERFRFNMTPDTKLTPKPAPAVSSEELSESERIKLTSKTKARLQEMKLERERLSKELPYIEGELSRAISDSSSSASSASRRYYAKTREETLNQQITTLKRRIDAVDLEIQRLDGELYH